MRARWVTCARVVAHIHGIVPRGRRRPDITDRLGHGDCASSSAQLERTKYRYIAWPSGMSPGTCCTSRRPKLQIPPTDSSPKWIHRCVPGASLLLRPPESSPLPFVCITGRLCTRFLHLNAHATAQDGAAGEVVTAPDLSCTISHPRSPTISPLLSLSSFLAPLTPLLFPIIAPPQSTSPLPPKLRPARPPNNHDTRPGEAPQGWSAHIQLFVGHGQRAHRAPEETALQDVASKEEREAQAAYRPNPAKQT